MSEKKFIDGLIVKPPRDGAPDYVVGKLSIRREALIEWLNQQDSEWVNADIKVGQGGKWYAQVDEWKPDRQRGGGSGGRQQQAPHQQSQRPQQAQQQAPVNDFADDGIPF